MALIVGLFLALVCIVVVALPFFRRRIRGQQAPLGSLEALLERRQGIYGEIKALRLEYELSRVSREEYEDRLQVLRRQAAITLRDQESLMEELHSLDEEMEQAILRARNNGRGPIGPGK